MGTPLEAAVQAKAGKCERRRRVQKSEPPGLLGGNEWQATEGAGQRSAGKCLTTGSLNYWDEEGKQTGLAAFAN